MDSVRSGIIGIGGMGSNHAGYLSKGEVPGAELTAVADAAAGNPSGKNYTPLSLMKDGGNDISYVEGAAPADAVKKMEEVRAAIKAGEFEVPRNFSEPT